MEFSTEGREWVHSVSEIRNEASREVDQRLLVQLRVLLHERNDRPIVQEQEHHVAGLDHLRERQLCADWPLRAHTLYSIPS